MTAQEYQLLVANCQPHPVFKLDWPNYQPLDFAATFLPDIHPVEGKSFYLFDGAALLSKKALDADTLMQLNKGNKVFVPFIYTYPKTVMAATKKNTVCTDEDGIYIFAAVYANNDVEVSFSFGSLFYSFLENYVKENQIKTTAGALQSKIYKTTIQGFKNDFGKQISHYGLMNFVGNTLGFNFAQVHQSVQLKAHFLKTSNDAFTPFGIVNPVKEDKVSGVLLFDFEILNQRATNYRVSVLKGNETIFSEVILPPVAVLPKDKRTEANSKRLYHEPGKYTIEWDGFGNDGILDSKWFESALTLRVDILKEDKTGVRIEKEIEFKRAVSQVHWLDMVINRDTKIIDIKMRLNLTDGGADGVGECKEVPVDMGITVTVCPWDAVPQDEITRMGKPILTERNKSFAELAQLAVAGFKKHWSRNNTNLGKGVMLGADLYQVNVDAELTNNGAVSLNSVPILFNTNGGWARSGNTGGVYKDDSVWDSVLGKIPDGIIQRIAYNSGYISYDGTWAYNETADEDLEFMYTAAHEIGHELLQAYAGTVFSWQHKGSSYFFPQETRPVKPDNGWHLDYMTDAKGEVYPTAGEIDLMKYYNGGPFAYDYSRIVAANNDLLGLIWLTKTTVT